MREISIDELKQIQLDILLKIDEFCRKNGIEYFLDGGTGIGAARHKGYIPWDDDIDIGMTRPNYEKFIHSFNGVYPHLDLYASELDWNYYVAHANVCDNRTRLVEALSDFRGFNLGVKVDIFPFDVTDTDYAASLRTHKKQRHLLRLMSRKRRNLKTTWKTNKVNFVTCVLVRTLTCFISFSSLQKKMYHNATRFKFEEGEYAYDMVNPFPKMVRCPRSAFDEYMDVEFEGHIVRTIKGYDTYLNALYPGYMTPPPEKDRVPHHGFTAYWLESDDK